MLSSHGRFTRNFSCCYFLCRFPIAFSGFSYSNRSLLSFRLRAEQRAGIPRLLNSSSQKNSAAPLKTIAFCGPKTKIAIQEGAQAPHRVGVCLFCEAKQAKTRRKPRFVRILRVCPCFCFPVRQGCGQQPCDPCVRFLCVRERNGPRVKLHHTHDAGAWSPCRALRGGALPLENRGGRRAEREARSQSCTRTRARSSSGEVEQKSPSRSRRIVVAKVLRT